VQDSTLCVEQSQQQQLTAPLSLLEFLPQEMTSVAVKAHCPAVTTAPGWSNTGLESNNLGPVQSPVTVSADLLANGHRNRSRYRLAATSVLYHRLHCSCSIWCTPQQAQLLTVTPVDKTTGQEAAATAPRAQTLLSAALRGAC
jgi:hypothetical protein